MIMKNFLEKIESLEKDIADERGDFSVFGLFIREDAENWWDIVVAAPWLNSDSMEDINYIANKLKLQVSENELLSISRIVLLDSHDPIAQIINRTWGVSRGKTF
jgi:hypothetical protein